MSKNPEIEFLEFLEPEDGIAKDVDITSFIMGNFAIPNLEDITASYYDTDALTFLRKSESHGYFIYYNNKLQPINDNFVHEKDGKNVRQWFNTIKNPVFAKITDLGIQRLYEYRTTEILKATNRSIVATNLAVQGSLKYQTRVTIITTVAIALTAIYSVISYYKSDSDNLILIRKSMQQQEQILKSIRQSQKGIDSSLRIMATKISTKK